MPMPPSKKRATTASKTSRGRTPKKSQPVRPGKWKGIVVCIVPARIPKVKLGIFEKRLKKEGAQLVTDLKPPTIASLDPPKIVHVVTELFKSGEVDKALFQLGLDKGKFENNIAYHSPDWLTDAFVANAAPPLSGDFSLSCHVAPKHKIPILKPDSGKNDNGHQGGQQPQQGKRPLSPYSPVRHDSPGEGAKRRRIADGTPRDVSPLASTPPPPRPSHITNQSEMSPASMTGDTNAVPLASPNKKFQVNHNKALTDALQVILDDYKARGHQPWRTKAYAHAISILSKAPLIKNGTEAQKLDGIGDRMANKIDEIIRTGQLQQAVAVMDSEESKVLKAFTGIWGAGPKSAQIWWNKGYRTLEQLRNDPDGAALTKQQRLGLLYYQELQQRIPRGEVETVEAIVKAEVEKIRPGCLVEAVGSYRRGKESCGDVDVLITHDTEPQGILPILLRRLHECDLLTDDLVNGEGRSHMYTPNRASGGKGMVKSGGADSYQGIYHLPREAKSLHRRIDIKVYKREEYAFALLYFTGSAYFNRTLRLWAQKRNLHLSDHGLLRQPVYVGPTRTAAGSPIPCQTEADIFHALELDYVAPPDRDV